MDNGFFEVHALGHLQFNEIDQQDGVAHNDAGQSNHANHAGGRELRIQQSVTGHHPNHGEWNRRHDDQGCEVALELRHHQQVNQDVGPMAANFVKTLLKNLLKSNKSNSKEEKKEQPTDCKTSQLNAFARFKMLETKVSALEKKERSADMNADRNNLEELIERIENLEKRRKNPRRIT